MTETIIKIHLVRRGERRILLHFLSLGLNKTVVELVENSVICLLWLQVPSGWHQDSDPTTLLASTWHTTSETFSNKPLMGVLPNYCMRWHITMLECGVYSLVVIKSYCSSIASHLKFFAGSSSELADVPSHTTRQATKQIRWRKWEDHASPKHCSKSSWRAIEERKWTNRLLEE